ncbi:MAG: hypothetical protein ABS36_15780 [Acidobacteria bacterium SCN 69-37]|nr:MAG: hypothetical protein ABS36_15780 [Acidobacteria bacterium SCN 69-37]
MRVKHVLVAGVCAVLLSCTLAFAQTTGMVAGSVQDTQGGVIPGATVVLTSETRGTTTPPVITSATGDFVAVNLPPDSYRVTISMDGFKTVVRNGITVSPGDRVALPALTLEVGGAAETVNVTATGALIQAQSGERSYTVETQAVQSLPFADRSFTQLAGLAPGVVSTGNTPARIGGGGGTNVMMDGVSSMDTGSNSSMLAMNTESIAEVKVLTAGYQAEFGRSSGVQITAVTKSGTNQFHGSLYDIERNSDWDSNSKVNILNGDPKTVSSSRFWGYSIGGPAGRPGGDNKLFFFYSHEFTPRTGGNNVQRFRVPTALERTGDFSQTLDNNGNLYNYIKDPRLTGNCQPGSTEACFADGGVLGRIPQDMLYQTGLNILNIWPMPNLAPTPGVAYNLEFTRPVEKILAWQPAFRVDYQVTPGLRATGRVSYWQQRDQVFNGSMPGFNDARTQGAPIINYSTSVNYALNSSTFLEVTYGMAKNELAGCSGGSGASFCTGSVPVNPSSSLANMGLENLPFLFPDATVLNPEYYATKSLDKIAPPFWDGSRMSKLPTFQWGTRITNTPPNIGFPAWFNINRTQDISASLTKVVGRHTFKAGIYNNHSYKGEQVLSNTALGTINFGQDAPGTNAFDTSFGFANAAIGSFSSFDQSSKYVETGTIYNNTEWYVQDNWKVTPRFTLDYGVRFVHQQPQYDKFQQSSNLLLDQWQISAAPLLYVPGCVDNAPTCTGLNRVAKDPTTGQLLPRGSSINVGTIVPNTGDLLNGIFLPGQNGLPRATFTAPWLGIAPRVGGAYDLTGTQRVVVRGSTGVFFDRPATGQVSQLLNNPPTSTAITARYSQLQSLGTAGLTSQGAPNIRATIYDSKLPTSVQWNVGAQTALPWATAFDVSYVGQHSYNTFVQMNINTIDLGTAFLPSAQDTTSQTPSVLTANLLRPMRGLGDVFFNRQGSWRTYHSVQLSFNRRMRHGFAFGFNDTISLVDRAQAALRLAHNPDGTYFVRDDQAVAQRLFGDQNTALHTMRANFVWDLPDLSLDRGLVMKAVGLIVNDWSLSGVWTGTSATPYTVGFNYQNGGTSQQLTGSNNFPARVRIVGSDLGAGCSSDSLRQFNPQAFAGPLVGSDGLDSDDNYLYGCFQSVLDLSIARTIRLGGSRSLQLRVDMFNAPNSAIITGRNATINLNNPSDPTTITNLAFDPATGSPVTGRLTPRGAGAGVATSYQAPRNLQITARFAF